MDQVIALFDFNATDPGELSFRKGEVLTILDRKYEHWWLCKNGNDVRGVVPRNHVKLKSRSGSASTSTEGVTSSQKFTPISKKMHAREVVSQLVDHGCDDLTGELDFSSFGENPVTHGGFSDIYRGLLLDSTRVAVKALRVSVESISRNPKHLKRAARELHTWSKCRHPNVIPLLGLAIFRGRIGMIAPWMTHGNLPRYLESTPGVDRLNLCVQICEGLSYLHRINIIHCDLKGANVLVSDAGIPMLTDFGNSSLVDRTLCFTQTTSGPSFTVRWSAAEIFEENALHTEASDVYALGMTIYETVAGKIPYEGRSDTIVFILVAVKKEFPERLQALPNDGGSTDRLWKLLMLCWSFEPAVRPSAAEVAESKKLKAQEERRVIEECLAREQRRAEEERKLLEELRAEEARRREAAERHHQDWARYEQQKWESEDRKRRWAANPSFDRSSRAQKPTHEQLVLDAWNSYEVRWSTLFNTSPDWPINFRDIPWPLLCVPSGPELITPQAVGALILSPLHSQDKSRKERLRNAMLLWHSDKFEGRWVARVKEQEQLKVKEAVDAVACSLTELRANPDLYNF
ncbi:unnamed protein product [Rhizoctonia solani]|uniref:mitogen-activated protein kinase kinase kinase n=1 Tax=Rhizoctonia solani TaxID=456999 RepID=A0A8H3CQG9_9AGAM|nr:unnamed protein product [Rhizoctonia solani]